MKEITALRKASKEDSAARIRKANQQKKDLEFQKKMAALHVRA